MKDSVITPARSEVKNEAMSFLREWARRPLKVASVTPSGRQLARLITSEIHADTGLVIELGPGTGVFTKALLERGIEETDLTLVELNDTFAAHLQDRFPAARVLCMGAERLAMSNILDGRKAGAIVSGLGLLLMPHPVVLEIMRGVEQHLAQGASFYQFTYARGCSIPDDILAELNLSAEVIGRANYNLPPATVFKVSRRP